ncbi:hypothetical protein DRW07_12335 [Alteromonas sediminis]|uniref:MaoC-like domain-containing protein n=1 Tax=Alteromonas sediminis TaxID=2259342 RepID=A0A3N5Z920_9ALTE|nr:MaoC/PaaZ C-terminal domain-containing protein [Alteromonas sediminis]RPJ65608.1 hypothetical protein DRW07_12335 [Alteromonas sediminis]
MTTIPYLFARALFKRRRELTPDVLKKMASVSVDDPYFKVDYANYQRYELATDWPSVFTHPCYLQMASLPMQFALIMHKSSPFKALGLVHIHNQITQQPSLVQGQPFSLKVAFGKVYSHKKGVAFEVVVTAGQGGKCVYEAIGTYLERRAKFQSEYLPACEHLPLIDDNEKKPRRTLKDKHFSTNAGRHYASISGDYNPIHLSAISAKLFGFKRAIAHGMFSMACGLSIEEEMLDFRHPDEPIVVKCDFFKAILLPSMVKVQSGPLRMDRLIFMSQTLDAEENYLVIQYYRGEAARLHRGL